MDLTPEQREILDEVERRKAANENPCGCGGPSIKNIEDKKFFCEVCWWEGVVLTPVEIKLLEEMYDAGFNEAFNQDPILDQQDFEY